MRVYLDNNATTPLDPAVLEAMLPYFGEEYGNPASVHWYGQSASAAVEDARTRAAALIGAEPGEIVFTSGATESNNAAIRGVARGYRSRGRHLVTTRIEHSSVLETWLLPRNRSHAVTAAPAP